MCAFFKAYLMNKLLFFLDTVQETIQDLNYYVDSLLRFFLTLSYILKYKSKKESRDTSIKLDI